MDLWDRLCIPHYVIAREAIGEGKGEINQGRVG